MELLKNLKDLEIKNNFYLKKLTSFKIGGRSTLFIPHTLSALKVLVKFLKENYGKFYILGGGSSLLINDEEISTPVVKLGKDFVGIERRDFSVVEVKAATALSLLLNFCLKNKLQGLEEFCGMPATVGGMAKMDASSFGKNFLSLVEEIELLDYKNDRLFVLSKEEIKREKLDGIITKLIIRLEKSKDPKKRLRYFFDYRLKTQDFSLPNAGCIFKNPENFSAGFLIEKCGFKGKRIADAVVSTKHANFILNQGNARFEDVERLIFLIKEEVKKKFAINLEEKIIKWRN